MQLVTQVLNIVPPALNSTNSPKDKRDKRKQTGITGISTYAVKRTGKILTDFSSAPSYHQH